MFHAPCLPKPSEPSNTRRSGIALWLALLLPGAAATEESIAFVIGNSAYADSPRNMFYRGTAKHTKARNRCGAW